jgi:hypothetical protein
MAPVIENGSVNVEEGRKTVSSMECNAAATNEAAEGNSTHNELQISNVLRWYGLFFGSCAVLWICILYSNVTGTALPTAATSWLGGIAAVVMTVGFFGLICTIITKSPNERGNVRETDQSIQETAL